MKNLILIITVIMLSACSKNLRFNELGTDTGNPYLGTDTGNPSDPSHHVGDLQPETLVVPDSIEFRNSIETYVCKKLKNCNATLDETTCLSKVRQVAGLPAILGFSNVAYINLNKIYADKKFSNADFNRTNLINCLKATIDMACTDTLVLDSWSTTAPLKFANVGRLFKDSASCTKIGK